MSKQLSEVFKKPVYWNKYKAIDNNLVEIAAVNAENYIRERFDASYQEVKRLFVPAYDNTAGNNQASVGFFKKYFLPRVNIEDYNIEIDGRNFYDQPINDLIKQNDEVRKVSIGQGDDYTTGCLLDYAYFKDNYRLITADLSKQKTLDADPRTTQQTVFQEAVEGADDTKIRLCTILEQSKETVF